MLEDELRAAVNYMSMWMPLMPKMTSGATGPRKEEKYWDAINSVCMCFLDGQKEEHHNAGVWKKTKKTINETNRDGSNKFGGGLSDFWAVCKYRCLVNYLHSS